MMCQSGYHPTPGFSVEGVLKSRAFPATSRWVALPFLFHRGAGCNCSSWQPDLAVCLADDAPRSNFSSKFAHSPIRERVHLLSFSSWSPCLYWYQCLHPRSLFVESPKMSRQIPVTKQRNTEELKKKFKLYQRKKLCEIQIAFYWVLSQAVYL